MSENAFPKVERMTGQDIPTQGLENEKDDLDWLQHTVPTLDALRLHTRLVHVPETGYHSSVMIGNQNC